MIADPPVDGSPTANVPTTTADGPGFGFAAAALALLTVALLAHRRH
ncbi:PGF-CTERM sorting domain-containing protein [Halorientalis persicus]|nr:PGF-CTERM sorting domain-containing protein [Halorientalis persicus]